MKKKVLIEEFMEGEESSVEAFVYENKINILALSDKIRTAPPYLLDTTVIFPSAYPLEIQNNTIEIAKKAINAVGIDMGAVHFEVMMTLSGPIPVEIAARGAGFKVYSDILPKVTGIDILKATIQCALGESANLTRIKEMASVLKFIEAKPGKIKKITNLDTAKEIPGIYEIEIYKKPGEIIKPLKSGDDRIGHIISFGDSREDAINSVQHVENILKIIVE
jgi:biotin carboxylase